MSASEKELLIEAFDSNWIAPLGPQVDKFEEETAKYIGLDNAAALTSGTAALHLALKILGIKEGDNVLCSVLSFDYDWLKAELLVEEKFKTKLHGKITHEAVL